MRILALVMLAGCGVEIGDAPIDAASGKMDDPAPAPRMTATEFFGKLGTQYCDECFRCQATYPNGQAAFAQDIGGTKQACYSGANAFYMPALVEQSIAAGRIQYNADAAVQCAAGIRYEPSCATFWQTDPAVPVTCGAVFLGTVPDGGTCATDYDCVTSVARCDSATKKCTR